MDRKFIYFSCLFLVRRHLVADRAGGFGDDSE
jgi:hypothetical protein